MVIALYWRLRAADEHTNVAKIQVKCKLGGFMFD